MATPELARVLRSLTTLQLGGPARRVVEAQTDDQIIEAIEAARTAHERLLILGGGSNVVIPDAGFPGTVLCVRTRGIALDGDVIVASAGELWESVVTAAAEAGLVGIECLTGIPGTVGAVPIQNVGAYGQEVSETITEVRVYDRNARRIVSLGPDDLEFDYRTSRLKAHPGEVVVLGVSFRLMGSRASAPLNHPKLARELRAPLGATVDVPLLQATVQRLRRAAGMVIDPADPDSVSAGSFFINPTISPQRFAELETRVEACLGTGERPRHEELEDKRVRVHAAWLIQNAGFSHGYGSATGAAISSKHCLALVNRGHATTHALLELALEIARKVHAVFGIWLMPEPVLVDWQWPPHPG